MAPTVQIHTGPDEEHEVRIRVENNEGEVSTATAKNPATRIKYVSGTTKRLNSCF